MANKVNPPKSHKYPVTILRKKEFDKKKFFSYTAVVAVAILLLVAQFMAVYTYFYFGTPYGFVRTSKYVVNVGDYSHYEVKRSEIMEMFDETKNALLKSYAIKNDVKDGNVLESFNVTVDIRGYLYNEDGSIQSTPFSNGTLVDYEITDIGKHYTSSGKLFMKEIQEAIIGSPIDSDTAIPVDITYPEDHEMTDLRGKKARLEVTIKGVTQTILPDYNNDFIARVTRFTTVEQYEENLLKESELSYIWNLFVSSCEVKGFPEKKVAAEEATIIADVKLAAEANEYSFSDYLKYKLIMTEEVFYDTVRKNAEGTVQEELILYWFVKKELIRYTAKEFREYKELLVLDVGVGVDNLNTVADLEIAFTPEVLMRSMYWEKAKQFLYNRTTILEDQ